MAMGELDLEIHKAENPGDFKLLLIHLYYEEVITLLRALFIIMNLYNFRFGFRMVPIFRRVVDYRSKEFIDIVHSTTPESCKAIIETN